MFSRESHYVETYPWLPWTEPVVVETPTARTDFACRLCIAITGITGADVPNCPKTREEFDKHMLETHGVSHE